MFIITEFGDDEILEKETHFNSVLINAKVDPDKVEREWVALKTVLYDEMWVKNIKFFARIKYKCITDLEIYHSYNNIISQKSFNSINILLTKIINKLSQI